MQIKVKKLHEDALLPVYASDGAGCFDIKTNIHPKVARLAHENDTCTFPTGLSFEIPQGYCMLIFSRSGHGFNKDVRLANCVGVIDSDYRGELFVKLTRDAEDKWNELTVGYGDRIAQGMIVPCPQVQFVLTDELSSTERGTGGFGSTGQ